MTCFPPKYDLLCTRLLHRIIVSISAYGIIIKSQYMLAKLVNSHDALSIVSSPAGLKLVYQAPTLIIDRADSEAPCLCCLDFTLSEVEVGGAREPQRRRDASTRHPLSEE